MNWQREVGGCGTAAHLARDSGILGSLIFSRHGCGRASNSVVLQGRASVTKKPTHEGEEMTLESTFVVLTEAPLTFLNQRGRGRT
jgi:hypothetical protein